MVTRQAPGSKTARYCPDGTRRPFRLKGMEPIVLDAVVDGSWMSGISNRNTKRCAIVAGYTICVPNNRRDARIPAHAAPSETIPMRTTSFNDTARVGPGVTVPGSPDDGHRRPP